MSMVGIEKKKVFGVLIEKVSGPVENGERDEVAVVVIVFLSFADFSFGIVGVEQKHESDLLECVNSRSAWRSDDWAQVDCSFACCLESSDGTYGRATMIIYSQGTPLQINLCRKVVVLCLTSVQSLPHCLVSSPHRVI